MPVHRRLTSLGVLTAVPHTVVTGRDLVHPFTDNRRCDRPTVPQGTAIRTLVGHRASGPATLVFAQTYEVA